MLLMVPLWKPLLTEKNNKVTYKESKQAKKMFFNLFTLNQMTVGGTKKITVCVKSLPLHRFGMRVCVYVCTELNSEELQGCSSDNSLNSNASLPSVQSHRRHTERRVASWAVCFERLLQDPVGVRYFSVLQQHMTGVGPHIYITDNKPCFLPTIKRTFSKPS